MEGERARSVELVILDSDGVLTDGGIYWTDALGEEPVGLRRFHVRDGLGVHMLRRDGIAVAAVSPIKNLVHLSLRLLALQ
jgi:3-deoxy-D-manno-octulosonate 8-phosphate phosphatase KdsC-like HAD superfamily phosphatase